MRSWGVQSRIAVGFGVILTLMMLLVMASWLATGTVGTLFKDYRATSEQSMVLGRANSDLLEARNALGNYRLNRDPVYIDRMTERLDSLRSKDTTSFGNIPDADQVLQTLFNEADEFAAAGAQLVALNDRREEVRAVLNARSAEIQRDLDTLLEFVPFEAGMSVRMTLSAFMNIERFLLSNDATAASTVAAELEEASRWITSMENLIFSEERVAIVNQADAAVRDVATTFATLRELAVEETKLKMLALDTLGPEMQRNIDKLLARVEASQSTLGADSAALIDQKREQTVLLGGVLALIGIVLAVLIGRGISKAVVGFADRMERLADGDLEMDLRPSETKNELGRMRNALIVFRDGAIERKLLEDEREETAAVATRQREAVMAELRAAFTTVVDAAIEGDFSTRVDENFDDAALRELSDGLNRLVSSVESGLEETNRIMARMAQGDLCERMSGDHKGAFADLKTNVNATIAELARIVSEIEKSGSGILDDTRVITEDAESLASRTTTQASALEETAATMEEMAATVKANVVSAEKVAELANRSAAGAADGANIVDEATDAMSQINDNASKITEIVSVIDDIAFQTNLLALNAAVEAARAGDAGKGFAVVAQEVRTLAQRASGSATDIRQLIQRSSDDVSRGVRLVAETGTMLKGLATSIAEVAEVTGEITAASHEQSTGVDEISGTVAHMDDITQKNASMADESARSARALAERAEALKQLLAIFNIDGSAAAAPSARPEAFQDAAWDEVAATPVAPAPARAASGDDWEDF